MKSKSKNAIGFVGGTLVLLLALGALAYHYMQGIQSQAVDQYSDLKLAFGVADLLADSGVHYEYTSGDLVVEEPRLKASTGMFPQIASPALIQRLFGMTDAMIDQQVVAPLYPPLKRTFGSTFNDGLMAVSLEARELRLARTGNDEAGTLMVAINGIVLSRPFLTLLSGDLVAASDYPEELGPPKTDPFIGGNLVKREWFANAVNALPGSGSFLIDAQGLYGATLDATLEVRRQRDGAGDMALTLVHRIKGREIGRIERTAVFARLPEISEVIKLPVAYAKGFTVSALGSTMGLVVASFTGEQFLRNSKLESYNVAYSGYSGFSSEAARGYTGDTHFPFCKDLGMSPLPLTSGASKESVKVNDSNCAIGVSLAVNGEYKEAYTFDPGRSAFAQLKLTEDYKVKVN